MTPESTSQILFFALAALAVASAVGMLITKNAIHSALFLVMNFAVVAVFFLLLGAPFIAMMQVTVYAGAIMVLFLFVIMLLGAEIIKENNAVMPGQRWLTALLGILLIGVLGTYVFVAGGNGLFPADLSQSPDTLRAYGSPQAIGQTLFNTYLLPFELTSFLLLVGMIGAVVLTRDDKKKAPK